MATQSISKKETHLYRANKLDPSLVKIKLVEK
jgi:hypothetical protein